MYGKTPKRQRTKLGENKWNTDNEKVIFLLYKELLEINKKKISRKINRLKNLNGKFTGKNADVQQHMKRHAPDS